MSDDKKYYYIRIKEDFYETEDMKILQGMDNGYLYSDILVKLYLKSLKHEGKLMLKDNIPYNTKMISTITNHNVDIVDKALSIFKELELIEVLDNGAIYMMDIQDFIGKSSSEADRKKAYRKRIEKEKNKLLGCTESEEDKCPDKNPKSTDEIPPENRDKRLENRDKSIENRDEDIREEDHHRQSYVNYSDIAIALEQNGFGIQSPNIIQTLIADAEIFSLKWVLEAITVADKKGVHTYSYVKTILNNWKNKGKWSDKHESTSNDSGDYGEQLRKSGIGFSVDDL